MFCVAVQVPYTSLHAGYTVPRLQWDHKPAYPTQLAVRTTSLARAVYQQGDHAQLHLIITGISYTCTNARQLPTQHTHTHTPHSHFTQLSGKRTLWSLTHLSAPTSDRPTDYRGRNAYL